jgi:hypothetical protein
MNATCQFTHDDGHVCGVPLEHVSGRRSRRKYCPECAELAIKRYRREYLRDQPQAHQRPTQAYEPKVRRPSKDKDERYARIIAQYGAPGMGISPIGRVRTLKAWKL